MFCDEDDYNRKSASAITYVQIIVTVNVIPYITTF